MQQQDIFPTLHTPARTLRAGTPTPASIEKKEQQAIRLIRSFAKKGSLKIAYSGGKDSDVVLKLAQLAGIDFEIIHNVTTIDPPHTIQHCIEKGAVIQRPERSFFQLVEQKGLPSMFRRFCCQYLKEKKIGGHVLLGVRTDESVKRAKRYSEPTMCRVFSKKEVQQNIYPILNWSDKDIVDFASKYALTFHPLYYDENNIFHVERRLGCIGCPLQGDRGRSDFLQYPKFLRLLCRSYAKYVSTHKAVEGTFEDIVWHLFYSNHGQQKYEQTFHGLFPAPNAKRFLEDYFQIDL